jgi:hypothetical protein
MIDRLRGLKEPNALTKVDEIIDDYYTLKEALPQLLAVVDAAMKDPDPSFELAQALDACAESKK